MNNLKVVVILAKKKIVHLIYKFWNHKKKYKNVEKY